MRDVVSIPRAFKINRVNCFSLTVVNATKQRQRGDHSRCLQRGNKLLCLDSYTDKICMGGAAFCSTR